MQIYNIKNVFICRLSEKYKEKMSIIANVFTKIE